LFLRTGRHSSPGRDEPISNRPACHVLGQIRPRLAFLRNHLLHPHWSLRGLIWCLGDQVEFTSSGVSEKVSITTRYTRSRHFGCSNRSSVLPQHVSSH